MQIPLYSPDFKREALRANGVPSDSFDGSSDLPSDEAFAKKYDETYRTSHPAQAAFAQNRFSTSSANKFSDKYRQYVAPYLGMAGDKVESALQSGYTPAVGIGALSGLGGGLLLQFIKNNINGESGGYDTALGLGALAGGALGGAAHAYRSGFGKQAFSMIQDPYTAVMLDPALSGTEKQEVLRALGRLNISEKNELNRLLSTVAGAGAGAFILRYLISKGLIPTAIGAILGGVIGRGMVASHKRNSLNQYY